MSSIPAVQHTQRESASQSRARTNLDLTLVNLATLALILIIVLKLSAVLRTILGIPVLLFCPGYTLTCALFPRHTGMDGTQRLAFSLGTSFAIVPLIGLILNYMPSGISLEAVLSSTSAITVVMSAVAWVRRGRLPVEDRFKVSFRFKMPGRSGNALDKALVVLVALSLIGAVAVTGFAISRPTADEHFTEFFILGSQGMAAQYPLEVTAGASTEVTVGITNREHETASYRLVLTLDGVEIGARGPIVLEHEDRWEEPVSFTTTRVGDDQKLELLLYRDAEPEPYIEPLRLWLDVIE